MLRFLVFPALLLTAGAVQAQAPLLTPGPLASAEAPLLGLRTGRVSYHLNVGATFAGRYGSASYISPLLSYRVSKRFFVFGGLTYLRAVPGAALAPAAGTAELPTTGLAATNHYLMYSGATYLMSPRLALTGSAWKDLTPTTGRVSPYAGFSQGQGMSMRADYRLTENMTISGGVRMSQGGGLGPSYSPLSSPFGY